MQAKKSPPRSALAPYRRGTRWYCRGSIPIRVAGGFTTRRIETSAGEGVKTEAQCKARCDELNKHYDQVALDPFVSMSFAEAMNNYLDLGRPTPKYATRLLHHLGTMECREITDAVMIRVSKIIGIKPSPQTLKRHFYMPVAAILTLASKSKACPRPAFTLPRGYNEVQTPKKAPTDEWFAEVLPVLPPKLRALVLYLTLHGRRLSDALALTWDRADLDAGVVELGKKTKNGDKLQVTLLPIEIELWRTLPREREEVFGYAATTYGGDAARKLLKETCERHGLPYHSPHALGRHAFARRLLSNGFSLQHVKDAGEWKSLSVVSGHYGHLAHSETDRAVLESGDKLLGKLSEGGWGKSGEAPAQGAGDKPRDEPSST